MTTKAFGASLAFAVAVTLNASAPEAASQLTRRQEAAGLRQQRPTDLEVTIHTPQPQVLVLALDEIELHWPGERRSAAASEQAAVETSRASVSRTTPRGVVMEAREVASLAQASSVARELEQRNPGATAYLVLYDPERPRTETTRQLLGREIAVLLDRQADRTEFMKQVSGFKMRPVTAVEGGYVIEAGDPLEAINLASRLREVAGVRAAYPLLQRLQVSR